MKNSTLYVYLMFAEVLGITDKMNVKIGVSDNPKRRVKDIQTGNPFTVHLIQQFEAGVDAYNHECHFHKLYKKYHTGGEWFEFSNEFFEEVVLPEMTQYFDNIEVRYEQKEKTTLSMEELLSDVKSAQFEVESGVDSYANRKIIQIKMKKALTLVDDTEKVKYQQIIDNIQKIIDEEAAAKRKVDQEKLAIKTLKRKAYMARKRLDTIAMGVLMGMAV